MNSSDVITNPTLPSEEQKSLVACADGLERFGALEVQILNNLVQKYVMIVSELKSSFAKIQQAEKSLEILSASEDHDSLERELNNLRRISDGIVKKFVGLVGASEELEKNFRAQLARITDLLKHDSSHNLWKLADGDSEKRDAYYGTPADGFFTALDHALGQCETVRFEAPFHGTIPEVTEFYERNRSELIRAIRKILRLKVFAIASERADQVQPKLSAQIYGATIEFNRAEGEASATKVRFNRSRKNVSLGLARAEEYRDGLTHEYKKELLVNYGESIRVLVGERIQTVQAWADQLLQACKIRTTSSIPVLYRVRLKMDALKNLDTTPKAGRRLSNQANSDDARREKAQAILDGVDAKKLFQFQRGFYEQSELLQNLLGLIAELQVGAKDIPTWAEPVARALALARTEAVAPADLSEMRQNVLNSEITKLETAQKEISQKVSGALEEIEKTLSELETIAQPDEAETSIVDVPLNKLELDQLLELLETAIGNKNISNELQLLWDRATPEQRDELQTHPLIQSIPAFARTPLLKQLKRVIRFGK